jgi:hypothetical protein
MERVVAVNARRKRSLSTRSELQRMKTGPGGRQWRAQQSAATSWTIHAAAVADKGADAYAGVVISPDSYEVVRIMRIPVSR